jgi:hypothetical protein
MSTSGSIGKFGSSPVDALVEPELAGLAVVPAAVAAELDGEVGAAVGEGAAAGAG